MSSIGRTEVITHRRGASSARLLPPRTDLHSGFGRAVPYLVGGLLGLFVLAISRLDSQPATLLVPAALFPFAAMIVGSARKLLLAMLLVDIPFSVDSYLGYQPELAKLGAIGGLNISATTIALAALYALWLADILSRQKNVAPPQLGASLPLAVYVGLGVLSLATARNTDLAIYEIALQLQMFLLYLYVASTVRTRGEVLFVVVFLVLGLALEGAIMLASQYAGLNLDLGSASTRAIQEATATTEFSRLEGTFGSPNVAGSYLSFLLPLAMALLMARLERSHGWTKWIAAGALTLGGLSLVLTFSRGGWSAFAVSTALLLVLAWSRGWVHPALPLAIGAIVLIAVVGFQDAIVARLFNERTALDRLPLIGLAWKMIEANPIFGVGANNFAAAIPSYAGPEFFGGWLYTVHNKYLLVWAEAGLPALIAFGWFLLVTLRRGWVGWRHKDRFLALTAAALTTGVMGQMVHMFFDLFNSKPQIEILWLAAGLVTALSRMRRE